MIKGSWGGYSSGSDDASSVGEYELENAENGSQTNRVVFPIKMVDHGSTYAKVLYDVEGNQLTDQSGRNMNIWTSSMKEAIQEGRLKVIHNIKEPSYYYFATSNTQAERFKEHRDQGAPNKLVYHVYLDNDADLSNPVRRNMFITKKFNKN